MTTYIVAAIKPWNIDAYQRFVAAVPEGEWTLIDDPATLTVERVTAIAPRYIFFPHWSWIVPDEILETVECVCFHMTDVPYGRGGSPLQNLIIRGHTETVVSALRMTDDLDAGPVYGKQPLSLAGPAHEIYERCSATVFEMISWIAAERPTPQPQAGEPTVFERRRPEQSRLPEGADPATIYDHIRMLDAPTYPRAFVETDEYRLEFSNAKLNADGVLAQVVFLPRSETRDNE